MNVVTRFAPSPTGYLHIGGARTALFNYLFAKHLGGKFLLRIEDTDLQRSTQDAVDAIVNGLNWLGIKYDEEPVFQMQQQNRHIEVAKELLEKKQAYKCYCTKEELDQRRSLAEKEGKIYVYDGRCRDITDDINKPYAIRLKVDKEGSTIIKDLVMGEIEVKNSTIDDFIILRSDSVPTYMFAVVVDDHDMKITHIIRGDDHLTNAFRQYQIYKALSWKIPEFGHLPLIHSIDGNKLSKRHGAISVENYQELGFLPESIRNYLLKLGWSHGDDEIISDYQAIEWFDIKDVNKSPARFDLIKLASINHHYLKQKTNSELILLLEDFIKKLDPKDINPKYSYYLKEGLTAIKERSKTIVELFENSLFYIKTTPFILDEKSLEIINNNILLLKEQFKLIANIEDWNKEQIQQAIKLHCEAKGIKLGKASEALRVALSGKSSCATSNFDIMNIIGQEETLERISIVLKI